MGAWECVNFRDAELRILGRGEASNQCSQGREDGEEEGLEWAGRWPLGCRGRDGGEGGEPG